MSDLEIRELEQWREELFAAGLDRKPVGSRPRAMHTEDSRTAERRAELLRKAVSELKCQATST